MKNSPIERAIRQCFTYETPVYPQAVLAAPQLVEGQSSLLGTLAGADRPPTPPELRVPHWGSDIAQNLSNLPGNILNSYKAMKELPLDTAKIQTEMQEQKLAQARLKGIDPNSLQYQTNIQGPNVSIPSYPIQFGGSLPVTNVVPQTSGTQQQSSGDEAQQPAATSPAQITPKVLTQQVPGIVSAATGADHINQSTDIQAPEPPNGDEVAKAYGHQIAPVSGWHREVNPDGSLGRFVMHHKDKGLQDQPLHDGWLPKLGINPAQANPQLADSPPASSPADQTEQVDPNNLAVKLASGTLQASDVMGVGGPAWAGTKAAPQAPVPPPGYIPPVPRAALVQTPSANQTPSQNVDHNHPALNFVHSDMVKSAFNGISPDLLGKALENRQYSIVGPAETSPDGGVPSTKVTMTVAGQQVPGYVDQDGNLYQVRNRTPYHETRVYANGTMAEIDNSISKSEDEEMMKSSMKNGTVSGNWQSLSRPQKIAFYKQAQAVEDYPVNQDQTNALAAKEKVIDAANNLLGLIQKNATPGDPTSLAIRNVAHQSWSNTMQRLGPAIKDITKGVLDPGKGDEQVDKMSQAYNQMDMAVRAQLGAPEAKGAQSVESVIGSLDNPVLPDLIQSHLKMTGTDMARQIDHMIANKQRIPASAVYKSNMITAKDDAPGGSKFPFPVKSRADYDKVPVGAQYQAPGYAPVTKLEGY